MSKQTQGRSRGAPASQRLRVLICAYSCDGADVGSAYTAYHWVKSLASHCDITLLTRRRNGEACGTETLPNVRTVHFDESPLYSKFVRFDRRFQPGYFEFAVRSFFFARTALVHEPVDLVHQITPGALRYPSPMALLGIPFVLGPVGGCQPTPSRLAAALPLACPSEFLRRFDTLRMRLDPLMRGTLERAERVLVFGRYVLASVPPVLRHKCQVVPDGGFDTLPPLPRRDPGKNLVDLLFVGSIELIKGLRFLLAAVAKVKPSVAWRLTVVGDGADLAFSKTLARDLGLAERVSFPGRVPRREVDDYYASADIFCLPTIREGVGFAILEAMSYGLPVIVCDYAGPADTVGPDCGFKIPPTRPQRFVLNIANAIERLAESPALRQRMGEAGRSRIADEFIWERRALRMLGIYRDVLSPSGLAP